MRITNKLISTGTVACGFLRTIWDLVNFTFDVKELSGQMYDIQGFRTFVFGGAASIDKGWRVDPETVRAYGKLWWDQEIPSQNTFETAKRTLADNDWSFDLFVSHTCSSDVKKRLLGADIVDFNDPVEVMLGELENLIKDNAGSWKHSFFGHFHRDEDIENKHCLHKRVFRVGSECTVPELK